MLSVFICYGGRQGEEVGNKLRSFLRDEGFDAFLASPGSPDIPAGLDFKKVIELKLRNAHIMVAICDQGILSSKPAYEEINLASQLRIPIIPFMEENLDRSQLPSPLQAIWAPIIFRLDSPDTELHSQFQLLEIHIFKLVFFKLESQGKLLGNQPTEIGIPPQILRGSV
jgi:hypothetical protein